MRIEVSEKQHLVYVTEIQNEMADSAKKRGTGIAKRSLEYLGEKIAEGKAILAIDDDGRWAGFCYIETWSDGDYVATSGLVVSPQFRNMGLARKIKQGAFDLARKKYPQAKLFGLTTGLAVMKINSDLGYKPVIYSELTQDEKFWSGCGNCINYEILMSKEGKNCLCTAMLFTPNKEEKKDKLIYEKESSFSV